jgi:hypothetical protein
MVLGIDLSGVSTWFVNTGSSLGKIFLIFMVVGVVGIGTFAFYLNRINKRQYVATVNLFKVVNGKKFWIGTDKAKEIVIPGTNIRLLRWKGKKIWSAFPTRSIGFNVYAYMINRMGEMTNFDLGESEDPTEAKIDYDHRDQTYAYLNLQEFITRNYTQREKQAWWKENIGVISSIVMLLMLGLMMWFFFSQSGKQLEVWTQISTNFKDAAVTIGNAVGQSQGLGSGVSGG